MNNEPLACPYCNALVPLDAGAVVGQRVPCPRCGEAFTLRQPPPRSSADLQAVAGRRISRGERPSISTRIGRLRVRTATTGSWRRRPGVMGLMAAIGLAYALYTQPTRRAYDTALPPPPRRSPLADLPAPAPVATAPAALEALRWLPPDCTLIAGVQLTELRQTEEGRDLQNHLFRIGKWEISADLLERWTGLKAREIDHLVVGVRAEEPFPTPTVVVVRTVRPYDQGAVKAALGAEPSANAAGDKTIYQGRPADGGFRPVIWFADERTLVVGLIARHLEAVPDRPADGLERLPTAVREQLQSLLPGGPVWVAGQSPDWRRTGAALLLGRVLPEKDVDLLGHVRDFAFQLQAERPMTLAAVVRCDGEPAAEALETRLTEAKPAGADWKLAREGPLLSLQLRGDPTALVPRLPLGNEDLGK